ncbi:PTS system ascorbate-specific IIB component [Spinactinospora alkalitolerans]|uniref:PTS system ascorbate-specific IIB component n=1 Tax=Spinactinospora alkalitolerans TaxID=687207 RepID=A0A852TTW8_9ACTN|nr:PTS sugar transporter subunit IIB [Spinactinospora alkalitolerans]NYE46193.1 PTS system ascorbate-specific IIB component [Spinactinospora alkalitolerans]
MKLLVVCGMGVGTSVILKTNAERAIRDLRLDAEVEVADVGTARAAAATADLVLTSGELAAELGDLGAPVVLVTDFLDADEIRTKIGAAVGTGSGPASS